MGRNVGVRWQETTLTDGEQNWNQVEPLQAAVTSSGLLPQQEKCSVTSLMRISVKPAGVGGYDVAFNDPVLGTFFFFF